MKDFLIQAQMHAECMNEALNEFFHSYPTAPSEDRKKVIEEELKARVWAVIYLIQSAHGWEMTEDAKQAIGEANAFNGPADEFDANLLITH